MNWKPLAYGVGIPAVLVIAVAARLAFALHAHRTLARFPPGMDADGDRHVSRGEWISYQREHPPHYPPPFDSEDGNGRFPRSEYGREFDRVDCDRDAQLDWCEYKQLRWNLRWCDSPWRPGRWALMRECLDN